MIDEKYLELFLDEVNEHIEDLNKSLLELEQDYNNREIINEIFRVAHTLKSSAGFVGLEYLSKLAHKMEDLFQLIKDRKIIINVELINLLFSCLDTIKKTVARIQTKEDEEPKEINELIEKIEEAIKNNQITENISEKFTIVEEQKVTKESDIKIEEEELEKKVEFITLSEKEFLDLQKLISNKDKVYSGYVLLDEEAPMKNLRLLLIYNRLTKFAKFFKVEPEIEFLQRESEISTFKFIIYGDILQKDILRLCQVDLVEEVQISEINISKQENKMMIQNEQLKVKEIEKDISSAFLKTRNIKVSSEKIDYLLNNVGELVITNSGLQKIYDDLQEEFGENHLLTELKNKIEQAIRIARELQSGIMKMRMMPVGVVFQRFYRPVRDLCLSLNKKVELLIEGEETELDKNIIDALNEPLMHLIRNAIDHGIETPEERIKKGKPETGKIILKSYQSGNHIFIEVQDDGRGLDKDKILKKAISKGLVSENQVLSDHEIYQFIFQSGFSTAETVSNVSGRGVGMDVVRKIAEEFKGGVQIQTSVDKGTSFILMFPLTLAIISTIHVKIQKEEYAFPLSDVVETIKIPLSQITTLQGKSVINLRKEIVPVYDLSMLMGFPPKERLNKHSNSEEEILEEVSIIITNIGNRKVGYIVDELLGKKEIVIKSLEQNYKQIQGLMGACLLGDGSIVIILDVNSLLELAKNYETQTEEKLKSNSEIIQAVQKYNQKVFELTFQAKQFKKSKKNYFTERKIDKSEITEANDKKSLKENIVSLKEEAILNLPQKENEILSSNSIIQEKINSENVIDLNLEFALENFKRDKERKKEIGLDVFEEVEQNKRSILFKEEDNIEDILGEEDYKKLYSIINSGMVNAGLVLSQLLGVTIDVSVPEFKTILFQEIINYLQNPKYFAIFLETTGEFSSLLVLIFDEDTGIFTAGELMGIPIENRKKEFINIEDIQSVLNELTNIVGSSLLNEIANRTSLTIKPSVPEFHLIDQKKLFQMIEQKKHPSVTEKIIYISTDFLRDETELLGKMFLLPSKPNLIELLSRIKI